MDIKDVRNTIDAIDEQITGLFVQRMNAAMEAAKHKKEKGAAIYDPAREREVLYRVTGMAGEPLERYARALYTTLFDVSRSYQRNNFTAPSPLASGIEAALSVAPTAFPTRATVACQGIEGAYSQQACSRMFEFPNILYFNSFDAVFTAVEKGLCRYGVLPIENSTAGSVAEVYDLMEKHRFYIVRGIRQRIDHVLIARAGASMESVKEIVSHPQAIAQCSDFLKKHPDIKISPVENTAVAARLVCESDRTDIAAIASRSCAGLYGLTVLNENVSSTDHNYTRFICIGKEMEVFPGSDKISMTISLSNEPGSLYSLLSRFATLGINLTKLESRPVAGHDFEFRFHFDIEASVREPEVVRLLADIEATTERFEFLGNYQETL